MRLRIPSLWRNQAYMILWSGQLVSQMGSGIQGLAFPLLILTLTGSALNAGVAGALFSVPYLILGLPAGVLVDRWNRKRVMMICDTIRAVNAASVPATAAIGSLTIWQLYANTLVEGICFVFFSLAQLSALPRVVPKDQLPAATAQNQASGSAIGLAAPPLGGLLFQTVGRTVPFLLNALSYAASVLSLRLIKVEFQTERAAAQSNFRRELKEGTVWLWNEPVLRLITLLSAGINFTAAPLGLILIVRARELHASPTLIGIMLAIAGIGGLLGALLSPRIERRAGFNRLLAASTWYQAVAVVLLALAPAPLLLGCLMAVLGVAGPVYNTVTMGYRLAATPDALQGRVNAAARVIAFAPIPLSNVIAGFLLIKVGAVTAIVGFAGVRIVLALVATAFAVRQTRAQKDPASEETNAPRPDPTIAAMAGRLKALSAQERAILSMRFAFDGNGYRSLDEVGHRVGLSKKQVREREREALMKLATW